ncbi:UBA/THIF-type NAD/FAD binding fold [Kalmanozyma brasiliensis GHG001]|uniref:UBA/THIF-type NAD/FAD binding fold n=1 Tax=Kalmanozyma brasiliensis (strain GHG001) TaxID=1365824 RepID=UPI002867E7CC|nr:UBA/THIF-type NAD/FAD binding fold [Kalmanozyma brasiliensis GHG001]EST08144.2 UBA/THIF-type NAD/FAD binding fold [Kalmanozyma brasiliensis GHG001]
MSDSSTSPSWLSALSTSNGRNALLLGSIAVGSSIATAAAIFGTQRITRRKKRQDLSDTVTKSANAQGADRLQRFDLDRDEASSTDGGTPRYLSGLQSNSLRPTSHLRNATSFSSSLPQSPAGPSRADTAGRNVPFARKRQPSVEQWDESLIREQLSRNYSFLGEEGMTAIRNSFVIVVGAGGVGSWAALMLLRSGISKLRLIDFDQVSLSSLNRHACATLEDVGRPKVVCCAEKFAQIAPWAKLEAWVELFKGDEAERLLGGNPTYVVDAIDNIDTKVDLLRFCAERKIKVISSMGAGAKSDPSRIQISDISVTSEDPLARSVRRRLRALGLPPIPPKEVEEKAKREAEQLEKAQTKGKPQRPNNLGKGKKGGDKQKLDVPAAEADLDRTPMKASPSDGLSSKAAGGDSSGASSPTLATSASRNLRTKISSSPSPLASRSGSSSDLTSLNTSSTDSAYAPASGLSSRAVSSSMPQPPRHSRRASSVSSFGSGAYATPMTTPSDEMAALLPDGDTSFQALDGDESAIAEPDTSTLAPVLDRRTSQSSAAASDATAVDLAAHTAPRTAITNTMRRRVSDMEELSPSPSPSSPALSRSTSFKPTLPTTPAEETTEPTFFIPCVYSTEKSDTRLLPLDDAEFARGNVDELAALEDFRVRILPVLGPLPAMFGLAVATFILCEIGGQKMEPLAFKGRRKLYEKLFHDLSVSESRHPLPGTQPRKDAQEGPRHYIPFSVNDIAYLFEEVFRGRSVVPPFDSLSGAQLERWDSTLPLSFQNVALFSRAQAKVHEREVLGKGRSPVEVWGGDAANMVRRRMASERRSGFFRF